MTRPEIIRADSIDLQDSNSPSAQDHTRQPNHPAPLGSGPAAPHQAEALREVAVETAEQNLRSPRVSKEWGNGEIEELQQYRDDELAAGVSAKLNGTNGTNGTDGQQQQQDDLAVAQNGGLTGSTTEDAEMADGEGDDGTDDDDDMMDKISSSPSIDDGGYPLPQLWPARIDSLSSEMTPISSPLSTQACNDSSSPFVETPDHYPLRAMHDSDKEVLQVAEARAPIHHLLGEYLDNSDNYEADDDDQQGEEVVTDTVQPHIEHYDHDYDLNYRSDGLPLSHSGLDPDVLELTEDEEVLTIPYEASDEEDDDYNDEFLYASDSRFIDSGWGGECLQELEDIDFEFVYALHTFVATVEGQANATKGDTMVLLDDSNSYWWLVRVVKDSSIGYLPAEHIETPTERLARLNKHRNIDLTSTMLGDQAEKTKNPLKKAIRRRNAKAVAFAAPTYFEASDVEYSTDEEEGEVDFYGQQEAQATSQEQGADDDEIAAVEPLKPRAELREVKADSTASEKDSASKLSSDTARSSDEIFEGKKESKSRNGTVRNTDSFFKDDTVETRKITLTPNLLRDDSSTSTARTSGDSKEIKQRPSLEKLEKDSEKDKSKDKKEKKDKKDKDKKPGMLSGLFKRKDKKSKTQDEEVDGAAPGSRSFEDSRSSPVPSRESDELVGTEEQNQSQAQQVQRQPSKLQKQPRADSRAEARGDASAGKKQLAGTGAESKTPEPQQLPAPDRAPAAESVQAPSMRLVQPDPQPTSEEPSTQTRETSPELTRGPAPLASSPPREQKPAGTITKMLRSASSSSSDPKPVKAKKAKARVELDDFDSSSENSVEEPTRAPNKQVQRPVPGSFPDSYISTPANEKSIALENRLSESPVQVSPIHSQSQAPGLMVDTSSQEDVPSSVSSPSPELIDADEAQDKKGPRSSSTSASTSTWSDSNLRTFFDDDADIKDLLVVVYDKSGVVPAGPDHPITGNMFKEENAKLAEITNKLDGMLGDWLARKMRTQASR